MRESGRPSRAVLIEKRAGWGEREQLALQRQRAWYDGNASNSLVIDPIALTLHTRSYTAHGTTHAHLGLREREVGARAVQQAARQRREQRLLHAALQACREGTGGRQKCGGCGA